MMYENSERGKLLLDVMAYKFAINDMSLFLDTHPNNDNALNLHNKYVAEYNKLKQKYENNYGPLCIETEESSWQWVYDKWPWEKEGV